MLTQAATAGYAISQAAQAVKASPAIPAITAETPTRVRLVTAGMNVLTAVAMAWANGQLSNADGKTVAVFVAQVIMTQLAAELTYHSTLKKGA
jgi:hypothetical protein